MSYELRRIIPAPQPEIEETLAGYQATTDFYREVQSRQEFKLYCRWYQETAEMHRQELQRMRSEFNILSWLRGGGR